MGSPYLVLSLLVVIVGLLVWVWTLRPKREEKLRKVKFNFNKFLKEMANEFELCEHCKAIMSKGVQFCPKCGKRNWKLWLECIRKGKI